jgi:monomeric sarcosine oxidase
MSANFGVCQFLPRNLYSTRVAHSLSPENMNSNKTYSLVIVGGGINGLCAAFHAIQRKISPVLLIDRFELGHDHGSSHGHSRVTRSAYVNEDYVRLMQVAHDLAWPELEGELGTQLIYPTEGCFFGPAKGKYESYLKAVTSVGIDCSEISVEEARKKYPQFRFANTPGVIVDRTAGLVAAQTTISSLTDYVRERIEVIENVQVSNIDLGSPAITLDTAAGKLSTEAAIVTAGPWAKQLLPELRPKVSIARQSVAYIKLDTSQEAHELGHFPVWGDLDRNDSVGHYGLPEFGRPRIKVARHVVSGRDDDPDKPEGPSAEEIDELREFITDCFAPRLDEIVAFETCHYTNTENEDYIIDRHPENASCVIGSGFSGHGFKLGPVTGRTLVDLAIDGEPSIEAFVRAQGRFALK